ncbi:hypothetical protein MA16_Dca003176 [Dendrobium catenatum]|uniref:Uncharacterized protein n=1 Tax=Dendrobium catenatum TaxID=906689 RepID=A0A2I0XBY0_9ASPA|nr:hypothetical protein MA16_Dca003176 [Dendrobium catenatum]
MFRGSSRPTGASPPPLSWISGLFSSCFWCFFYCFYRFLSGGAGMAPNKLRDPGFLGGFSYSRSFLEALVGTSSSSSYPYFRTSTFRGLPSLWISDQEIKDLATPFQFSLVGFFPSKRPSLDSIRNFFYNLKLNGDISVTLLDPSHILIKLANDLDNFVVVVLSPGASPLLPPVQELGSSPAPLSGNSSIGLVSVDKGTVIVSTGKIFEDGIGGDLPSIQVPRACTSAGGGLSCAVISCPALFEVGALSAPCLLSTIAKPYVVIEASGEYGIPNDLSPGSLLPCNLDGASFHLVVVGEDVRMQIDWLQASSDSSSEDSGKEEPGEDFALRNDRPVVSVTSRGRGNVGIHISIISNEGLKAHLDSSLHDTCVNQSDWLNEHLSSHDKGERDELEVAEEEFDVVFKLNVNHTVEKTFSHGGANTGGVNPKEMVRAWHLGGSRKLVLNTKHGWLLRLLHCLISLHY